METSIQNREVTANGIRISYKEQGEGETVLIFIHGFPFTGASWEPQLRELSRQYRVIVPDTRGYGGSEPGPEKASIDLFASDLLQFIDALSLKQVIACGLSMGGYILMNAVTRQPEKFKAIILADTQCIADSEEGKEKRRKTIEKIEKEGLEKFAEGFVPNLLHKKTLEKKSEIAQLVTRMIVQAEPAVVTGTLKALAERRETCNSLKNIDKPALIICGKEDTVTPMSQSELLNNTIKDSTLKSIANAGHLSNLEQPEEFNKAVSEFVKNL